MAILKIKDGSEWKEIEAIKGDKGETGNTGPQGPKGENGVWTGTTEPSSDYDVWIIPDGTPGTIPTKVSQLENDSGYITSSSLPTKVSDLQNDSGFIDNTTNTLTNYELKTNTGATIDLSIDSSTYVMTLALKNSAGTTISTDSIDLPLETMVVGASYDNQTKEIVLTLKNGNTTRFSVADLVSGLVSDTYLTTNYYNKSSVDTMIAGISASETLPVGSEIDFDGITIPTGWEEIPYSTDTKILWENEDTTVGFGTQTINFNSSDFDVYEVYYYTQLSTGIVLTSKSLKGHGTWLLYAKSGLMTAQMSPLSDTSYMYTILDENTYAIPIKIIGYKTGLFNNGGNS